MTYFCDICEEELPEGYTPEVDHRGRPCLAICERCKAEDRETAEARRASREACRADLLDQFSEVLEREITPRMGH